MSSNNFFRLLDPLDQAVFGSPDMGFNLAPPFTGKEGSGGFPGESCVIKAMKQGEKRHCRDYSKGPGEWGRWRGIFNAVR
jgi:hypothetical protein